METDSRQNDGSLIVSALLSSVLTHLVRRNPKQLQNISANCISITDQLLYYKITHLLPESILYCSYSVTL
jgi:hypothetical protein